MPPRVTRLELILVAILFLIGLGLRAASSSRMAVEHFDEGVYASNLYTLDGRYPFQHLYAPPLVPFCLEWAAIFGGPQAVMWVNVLGGSLTLLVLWGMVRQWWGPPAAIAAMGLLAFNEFHIAYSRAALTDALLGLWMTAGVWAGWRAIQIGGPRNIAAAGLLAALAWWTKYNGWLTLAITGAGTAGWILFGGVRAAQASRPAEASAPQAASSKRGKGKEKSRPPVPEAPKTDTVFGAARLYLGRWALTAAIAFLLWLPWLWELQQYGGYAAVAKNHAGYFTGFGQWWSNAVRQTAALAHDCRLLTKLSPFPALLFATAVLSSQLMTGSFRRAVQTTQSAGSTGEEPVPGDVTLRSRCRELSLWMAAAWLIGLTLAVPLYTPYPRLVLPWLLATVVGLACLLATCLYPIDWNSTSAAEPPAEPAPPRSRARRLGAFLAAFVVLVAAYTTFTGPTHGPYPAWEDRGGLRSAAAEILSRLQSESLPDKGEGVRCAISVVAEPGLFFHLGAAQAQSPVGHVALPAADFSITKPGANTSGLPVYLALGPHADNAEADRLVAAGRLEPVAEFEYRPSDLVLLDNRPAWDLPARDQRIAERIRLFHVKP